MPGEYLLNKVYESLIYKKVPKSKSAFRSLSESYVSIYEQDQDQNTQVPNQSQEQQPTEAKPQTQQIAFNVQEPVLQRQKWTPEQSTLFNIKTSTGDTAGEGTGRGEYAVASVLTGQGDLEQVKDLISGGSKSYDVSWPSKDKPTYKFEVKELERFGEGTKNDVRIGTEGDALGRETIATVTSTLKEVLEEYNNLSPEEQKQIDQEIISYSLETKTAPEPEIGRRGETQKSKAARQKYEQYQSKINTWSLRGYINAVLNKPQELGSGLLFSEKGLPTTAFRDPERIKYCFISIKRLYQSLDEISQILKNEKEVDEENPRIMALRNTLRTHYAGDGESNEIQSLKAYLDSEAQKIDKKLIRAKCKATGENCVTGKTFYKDLEHLQLAQTINNLQQKLYSPETIRSFFPKDLTGFFAVSTNGYLYAPTDKIGELVTFHSISLGRPKIRLI